MLEEKKKITKIRIEYTGFEKNTFFKDFKERITIGCIPGGTGNGLVKSLLSHVNEQYGVLEAAFRVSRG